MPTMAAGHFTEELVAADNSTVLNNIATVLLPEFAGLSLSLNWLDDFSRETISVNRLNHIFGKTEHALESLVSKFGSQEAAYATVQKAANEALKAGKLTPNSKGILPSGDLGNLINVEGMNVRLIGGRVENGTVIISSFSRKGL